MQAKTRIHNFIIILFSFFVVGISAYSQAEEILLTGQFQGASDHVTSGNVDIVQTSSGYELVLRSDFSLDGAPDPKVGFGVSGNYDSDAQLAHLKANSGEQRYAIPEGVDPSAYNEVYIWCEQYSVPLGVADLN